MFLCQGAGTRRWQVSTDRSLAPDYNAKDLALLKPFVATTTHNCTQGDVLYLPPGIPHWGVATEKCTTYSVGLRAPTRRELAACESRIFSRPESEISHDADCKADIFYGDPDLKLEEIAGAQISARSIERLFEQDLIDRSMDPTEAATVFGSQVTDPKAWLDPEKLSPDEARLAAATDKYLNVHGMARLAWYEDRQTCVVFVNGDACEANPACIGLLRRLFEHGNVRPAQIQEINQSPENAVFLSWLLERGAFDVQPDG